MPIQKLSSNSKTVFRPYYFLTTLSALFLFFCPKTSWSFEFSKNDLTGFLDTTVSSGVQIRTSQRSHSIIGIADGGSSNSVNSDKGDLNYSKGSVVSAASIATSELGLTYQNLSAFFRATYFFDPVNDYKKELTPYERTNAGHSFQLLDAYIEKKFHPDGKELDVRIGKQVINWGESTYIAGGLNVSNAIDVTKLRLPGSEIRQALIPNYMISDSYQVTDNVSWSNYYLFHYDRTRLNVCGTYFSTSDVFCDDGSGDDTTGYGLFPAGTAGRVIHQVGRQMPSNDDQFGTSVHYQAPQLNNTDFGLYFENYDNHVPVASGVKDTPLPSYILQYIGNLQVYGVSANTDFFGIALQGEYSFRPSYPFQIETIDVLNATAGVHNTGLPVPTNNGDIVQGYRDMPVNQIQATATKSFGRQNPFFADDWTLQGEAAAISISHFPNKNDLRFDAPGVNFPSYTGVGAPGNNVQTSGWADSFSWGYILATSWSYYQVIKNIDLTPRLVFTHDVEGTTPAPLGPFLNGRMSITVGLTAKYLEKWTIDMSYTNFFGAKNRNGQTDRDFASVTVKYWF